MLGAALESLQKLVLPDRWQAAAIQALLAGRDVVVDAPTGAGKTFIFERWVEQINFSRRTLFTVPTRALANDKFAEWRARGWRVGIITGDVTIEPGAPVVVATLEAVQGLITESRPATPAASFQLLVVDEYHWLADAQRGNHYEGVLLSALPNLQLLLLSGAVENPEDVAAWLRRLGRNVEVVQTRDRPVPLEEVEADELVGGLPKTIEGFWSRRVAGALRAGYGPVLIFAPHRQDAERLARQCARELPLPDPLTLTREQELACGPALARLIKARVAYHHSGLTYLQRAGVIEPLAKAGQLRAVVATLGLSAGINFSLRSVLITAGGYLSDQLEREIAPHNLLQMIGRAGRRGLDECGFVLVSSSTPRLRRAAPLRLKRAAPLPWAFFLRRLRGGADAAEVARTMAHRFFTEEPLVLGAERTAELAPDALPCRHRTDTGRARLVRREKNPFPACAECAYRAACLELSPQATLLWQWQRVGVLDRELRLTPRGEIVSVFLGPEGLALVAALSDHRYPLDDLLFDCANLFAGDRFAGTNPRRIGRLAFACEKFYRRLEIDGWLERGVPPAYGSGAAEIVRSLVADGEKARKLVDEQEYAGRGDFDRLLTEWRSLLRQVAGAPPLSAPSETAKAETRNEALFLGERWDNFRALCRAQLGEFKPATLPDLPPLTPEQRRPLNHRFFPRPAGDAPRR
ncbi:MAG: DEAD/DEAH box helicase [Opitutae bacterium]|nr:DEAD/DEAH box helicase [Opitutae bacterium]